MRFSSFGTVIDGYKLPPVRSGVLKGRVESGSVYRLNEKAK